MKHIFFMLLLISLSLQSFAQATKVVGFLPHYRFQHVDDIDFSLVTHVNLAFANPDMEGNLSFEGADIQPIIDVLKAQDKEVFISLAGGYLIPEWDLAWIKFQKEENRSAFIHQIMEYCKEFQVDGIDMDLEWQYVGMNYSGFVQELADSCFVNEFVLTASLPGTYRYPDITDEALEVFEWINMMVYDLRGPWNPNDAGPHSPYYFALNSIEYWNQQGVANSRLSMGLPFYGYDFTNTENVFARTYRNIVDQNPANAFYDKYGEIYYNGIPTIKSKTQLAIDEELVGVMIWELGQDNFGDLSLLKAIDEVINPVTSIVETSADIKIYPNPANAILHIAADNIKTISVYDMLGNLVVPSQAKLVSIDISELQSAIYVLILETENGTRYQRSFSKI